MNMFDSIKNALSERKAKRQRRAAMSFNSSRGGGSGKGVRPEPPGTGITDSSGDIPGA